MRETIVDIKEITYSREIYEAKPKPFAYIFIYILSAIIIITISWSYFGEIDIVVKGNGIVRPNENISTIKSTLTGEISQVNVKEGKFVRAGDILYIIKHESLLLERDKITEKLNEEKEKLKNLNIYKESIEKEENLFLKEENNNEYYSSKYEHYKVNLDYLKYQLNENELQLSQSDVTDVINTQLETLKDDLELLTMLRKSIEENRNYLNDTVYYNKFKNYKIDIDILENDYSSAKKSYENAVALQKIGAISVQELDDIKKSYEDAKLALEQYKTNYISSLEKDINDTKEKLSQTQLEYNNALLIGSRLNNKKDYGYSAIKKYKLDTLVAINDEIKSSKETKKALESNLESINLQIKNASIVAPIDGRVNILSEVATGDYIVEGTELMSIIPIEESQYRVQIILPNKDIASINKGDDIKFQFHALPYKEYGEFTGKVTNISSDIKTDVSNGSYYLIEANLEEKEGVSYKGEKRTIKVGMTCDAHIITEQKKILYWILEKIDLRD